LIQNPPPTNSNSITRFKQDMRKRQWYFLWGLGGGTDNSTPLKTTSCNLQNQNLAPPTPLLWERYDKPGNERGGNSQLRKTNGKFVQPNSTVEIIYCTYNWCSALLCQTFIY
jgi:hypothetical protein